MSETLETRELMRALSGPRGVDVRDRWCDLRRHPACFTGTDAVDVLCARLSITRSSAIEAGRRLLAQGRIHAVGGTHGFDDAPTLFAVGADPGDPPPATDLSSQAVTELARAMRAPDGLEPRRHRRGFVQFPACFEGRAVVDWIVARTRVPRPTAATVASEMLRQGAIRHVFDEHGFEDGSHLYRFVR